MTLAALLLVGSALSGIGCHGDDAAAAPVVPAAIASSPAAGASDVPVNAALSSSFSTPMAPLNTTTFSLMAGTTAVPGTVATSADGKTATFTPDSPLSASTLYSATISADAMTLAGAPLGTARTWTFTTGTIADIIAPTVTSRSPGVFATSVPLNTKVSATFNEAMNPTTLTPTSFMLVRGTILVSGSISYGPGTAVVFTPTSPLLPSAVHTATITTAAEDLQGNALASDVSWSFTTGMSTATGPAPVLLGAAGDFAILAKAAVSTVPDSAVTGDVGLSPAAATFLTGFSMTADSTNVFSTSPQVTGQLFASNYAVPTPSNLTTAVSNMESAYTDAANRPTPDHLELGSGTIGGLTLAPGLYKWTSTVSINSSVTISGGANDVWIFQTTGDLSQAASTTVILSGGAQAKNIFWQVAGIVTVGATAHFEGIILCQTEVTLVTGASLNGRILAQTQVAIQQATVTQPTE